LNIPGQGIWTIAFVTGSINQEIATELSQEMVSVFVPTTPNPTSGWYAIVPSADVTNLSMSVEDAFKIIVSGGIVNSPASVKSSLTQSRSKGKKLEPLVSNENQLQPVPVEEEG
jgi:uncharacterized membrane protein